MDSQHCSYYENAGINCWKVDPKNVTTLRLADTSSADTTITGRLEVLVDGEWGTVCGYYFDSTAAQVACRGLGYSAVGECLNALWVCIGLFLFCAALTITFLRFKGATYFACSGGGCNPGEGKIAMDGMDCNGEEETLLLCDFWSGHSCWHGEDIGITCQTS